MNYSTIINFDQTDLVRTICTQKSADQNAGVWKYGEEGALQNYEALAKLFGISLSDIVHVKQTHTAAVRIVTREDGGEEILRPESVSGFDGMITNEKRLLLCTLQADCVPVFLLDPVQQVIGMVHSDGNYDDATTDFYVLPYDDTSLDGYYAAFAKLPCFEPATAQEAYDFTRLAFELSEKAIKILKGKV